MLEASNVQENNLKPSVCCIEWRIQNFCIAVRTDESVFFTPEFQLSGRKGVTKWRMKLVVKDVAFEREQDVIEEGGIFLVLERLSDTTPGFISLNWEVSLIAGEKEFEPNTFSSSHFTFERNFERIIPLKPVKDVLEYLLPFRDDTITIKFVVMALINGDSTHSSESPAYGLKRLSDDLIRLKEQEIFPADITLRVDARDIKAHKAILCRNRTLESYFEKAVNGVIELTHLDYDAVDKFVEFLYSGNIDDILSDLSIFMIRCLMHFDEELLKCYFSLEELKVFTEINAVPLEFRWSVKNLATEGFRTITSPSFSRSDEDTKWQLDISLNKLDHGGWTIALCADNMGEPRPRYFYLDFCLQKDSGEAFHPRRFIRSDTRFHSLGFDNFIKICDLHPSINIHETIIVVLKTITSDGIVTSDFNTMPSISNLAVTSSYEQLSRDLMALLKSQKYCDMVYRYENKSFNAHKCILASRSSGFPLSLNEDAVSTLEKVEELESVLDYLYSGILKDKDIEKVEKIRNSADVLGIKSLAEECGNVLRDACYPM